VGKGEKKKRVRGEGANSEKHENKTQIQRGDREDRSKKVRRKELGPVIVESNGKGFP